MRPLIGLTVNEYVKNGIPGEFVGQDYTDGVYAAGGLPLVLPLTADKEAIVELANRLDGLILTGGSDIAPQLFHEEPRLGLGEISPLRDAMEAMLIVQMVALDKPILAICRGIQIVNAVMGGTLYQDLLREWSGRLQHAQKAPRDHVAHSVSLVEGSRLHALMGAPEVMVNTFHHQAVSALAPGFVISGRSHDGLVEAIEHPGYRFIVGVQWHPENLWRKYPEHARLFTGVVEASRARAQSLQ
ncbi:MAG: gamma-glutamyl-gamma-aminobutyrate hydrolase family protein [Acidibacillus sp.]|uniref:Glutamine amidotransferase n=1 Tax=Sulfoacidibacillus ferrooxidans TaxID=2005001 RepID=A0A9X2AEU6_9BACL|nr:gamma-glutamyl-gamma-aminobutyrate hydrolase family protein [Sulfoacidibacillus ferrooxidans]MCI0183717.1 putative glutamine amidotransferase [Sulfoacidibacillus ferrooxidans]MCY0892243.1 gamma-glutamyl-gamma-aminobutyrate hydrolase family protein [Acidibacillus sp.]